MRRILFVCLGNFCRSPSAALALAHRGGTELEAGQDLVDKPVGRVRTTMRTGPLRHRLPQVGIGQERAQHLPHPGPRHLAF